MSDDEKDFKFKVIVVGDPAVGKTTLIRKYTTGTFQKDYIATLGAQFSNYEENLEGKKVRLFIWDIAGQETFEIMRQKFYKGTSGAIIVFSHAFNEKDSFNHLGKWFDELYEYCGIIPMALFGNKIDLVDESEMNHGTDKIGLDVEVNKFVNDYGLIGYFKTSALTGHGVIDAFQKLVRMLYFKASYE